MDLNLKDKIVLVTGGTGDIGKEIVRAYIEEEAIVCFLYHRAEEKAAELMDAYGKDRCMGYRASVLDRDALSGIIKTIHDNHQKIDILVNNAGITDVLPFPLIDEEDWDACMDINTKGPFLVTKAVARGMLKNREGCIINIGSLAGERILEVPVHYATAKAGITGFTLALTKEFSRYNIRVKGKRIHRRRKSRFTGRIFFNDPVRKPQAVPAHTDGGILVPARQFLNL